MTPPELRIGSTMQAARLPTDCASTSVEARSRAAGASRARRRRGEVRPVRRSAPGSRSCPARPGRSPCGRRCRWRRPRPGSCRATSGRTTTISCLPVTSLAIRIAASFDSAPVVSSSTFSSGSGSDSASRRARSTTGRDSMPLNRWSSVPTCRCTVATIVRVRVPEDRAHLPGREVEDPPARPRCRRSCPAARSMISGVKRPAPVADQMPVDVVPEPVHTPTLGTR